MLEDNELANFDPVQEAFKALDDGEGYVDLKKLSEMFARLPGRGMWPFILFFCSHTEAQHVERTTKTRRAHTHTHTRRLCFFFNVIFTRRCFFCLDTPLAATRECRVLVAPKVVEKKKLEVAKKRESGRDDPVWRRWAD